ncbi:MAG: hypothetical protein O2780_21910 [Proteobacteria bacterium]|jgi:hypothetical protein|nr:hypothetical protein [Pseudomonadota bacterium]MDA1301413.1 hypothetical protein [Pseudomonadota bacterium]
METVSQYLKTWLEANLGKVPKDSLIRTAMQYMRNQWEYIS